MKSFITFTEAVKKNKKKKSEIVPTAPTTVSAPLRGQNQDYSGVSPLHNNADYTISD